MDLSTTMFRVDYHWDRLKTCVVGSVYQPEHFQWVEDKNIRSSLERLVIETEEDFQKLIKLLESFAVNIVRPLLPEPGDHFAKPVVAPRDYMAMIGNRFFCDVNGDDLINASGRHRQMAPIINLVREQGNEIILNQGINSAEVIRMGKDLYWSYPDSWKFYWDRFTDDRLKMGFLEYQKISMLLHGKVEKSQNLFRNNIEKLLPDHTNHFLGLQGHIDGIIVPVSKDLMLVKDEPDVDYLDLANIFFPSHHKIYLKQENEGIKQDMVMSGKKWWIPGKETDHGLTDFINRYFNSWITDISETRFEANTLMIDSNNAICVNFPESVLRAYEMKGITPHVINFRHRFFWDGGIHCITADLDREPTPLLP